MPYALVTGSGVRVGRAIARALAEAGYDLVLHARASGKQAEQLAREVRSFGRSAHVVVADLTTAKGIEALAKGTSKHTQQLDVLVNNAGVYQKRPFAELTRKDFAEVQALNLEAPLFLTQRLLPMLGHGACVVMITDAAVKKPYAGYAHYMASKAALDMLVRCLAIELAPKIRVVGVAPGMVAAPEDFSSRTRASIVRTIPLAREGSPHDVARAVVYLAREAPYMTGCVLPVDGGWSLA